MAQAAVEIIQEYHQHMNGEKLGEMLNTCDTTVTQLPPGIVLEKVDLRHLALPFPPQAILPTMRLVFATMKNEVRFGLSDHQVNNITTGSSSHQTTVKPIQADQSEFTHISLQPTCANSIPSERHYSA